MASTIRTPQTLPRPSAGPCPGNGSRCTRAAGMRSAMPTIAVNRIAMASSMLEDVTSMKVRRMDSVRAHPRSCHSLSLRPPAGSKMVQWMLMEFFFDGHQMTLWQEPSYDPLRDGSRQSLNRCTPGSTCCAATVQKRILCPSVLARDIAGSGTFR